MKKEDVDKLLSEKLEDGEHVSPVLPDGMKNYLIDIDGTICDDIPNEEPERMLTAEVYPDALKKISDNEGMAIYKRLHNLFENILPSVMKMPSQSFICKQCNQYIEKGKRPPLCFLNGLAIMPMPDTINLNELSQTLIAKIFYF